MSERSYHEATSRSRAEVLLYMYSVTHSFRINDILLSHFHFAIKNFKEMAMNVLHKLAFCVWAGVNLLLLLFFVCFSFLLVVDLF